MNGYRNDEMTEQAEHGIIFYGHELNLSDDDEYETDEQEIEGIFDYLQSKVKPIEFSNYLKRLIARKLGWGGDSLADYPNEQYAAIISQAFTENDASYSLSEREFNQAGINNTIETWLNAKTVKRETVFTIGFGLKLTPEEVAIELLQKGLAQSAFYFCNYEEIIYWYCYRFGLSYKEALELKKAFEDMDVVPAPVSVGTKTYEKRIEEIKNKEELLAELKELKKDVLFRKRFNTP